VPGDAWTPNRIGVPDDAWAPGRVGAPDRGGTGVSGRKAGRAWACGRGWTAGRAWANGRGWVAGRATRAELPKAAPPAGATVVFKSLGQAVEDACAARLVYDAAIAERR